MATLVEDLDSVEVHAVLALTSDRATSWTSGRAMPGTTAAFPMPVGSFWKMRPNLSSRCTWVLPS